jgi:hypothetical protein
MDIREIAMAAYRAKGWTPSDLWRAMGGDESQVKYQTVQGWANGLISRTTGERIYPELKERHLGEVLDALGLELRPVVHDAKRSRRK